MDISLRYGIGPDVYYVPVQNVYGAPYGRAYGYYQNRNRNEWNRIRLADDDVVNLVNLRFISERYGYAPEEVMRMRSSGRSFETIHDEARRSKGSGDYRQQDRRESREPVIKQERRDQEYRQQDRRDARESVIQPERLDQEYRQQDRREVREPLIQRERQERETRQQDRRDTREPVMQQGRQQKEIRQQDRQETRETVKQQDRQKKETRQKGRKNDEGATDKQDKKGKGAFRSADEERGR